MDNGKNLTDDEFEKIVLSEMACKDGASIPKALAILDAEDFSTAENKFLFNFLVGLNSRGIKTEERTVIEELRKEGYSNEELARLYGILFHEFTDAYLEQYARIIKEKSDRRKIIELADKIGCQAKVGIKPIADIIADAAKEFSGFKNTDDDSKSEDVEVLADVFDNLDEMSEEMQKNLLKWGFPILDEESPMLPGCYLLGALPSLGKTAFALNVAANVCEQGSAVLYISYEPTAKQVAVKNLAGYWFRKIWNNHKDNRLKDYVPTATQIMLGRYNEKFGIDEMKKVREELKTKRKNFYFFQGRNETARDLISKIKPYVDNGVKFVVVDYIQLIKGTDTTKTAREQIDETIRELQIFQSKNDLVILFISSFNRENYRNYACLEAFKESGGLEFTADGIFALQFKYSTGESRTNNEKFQEKKQAKPRDMELVSLKNRFGIDFVDEFAYHSAHETFIEKIPAKENTSSRVAK